MCNFFFQCPFFEFENFKVIYKRYASLFFIVGVDSEEVSVLSQMIMLLQCKEIFWQSATSWVSCTFSLMCWVRGSYFPVKIMKVLLENFENTPKRADSYAFWTRISFCAFSTNIFSLFRKCKFPPKTANYQPLTTFDSNYDNSVIWVTLMLLIIIFLLDALNSPKSTIML